MSLIPEAIILDIDLSSLMTMGLMEPRNNKRIQQQKLGGLNYHHHLGDLEMGSGGNDG